MKVKDGVLTDKDLLELAAKAAGNGANSWSDYQQCLFTTHGPYPNTYKKWNPLADDGDEARLEAVLALGVIWYPVGVQVGPAVCGPNTGSAFFEYFDQHAGDKQSARRLAGVKAAASILVKPAD